MKFGFCIPRLNKRLADRTSIPRIIRHNFGFKVHPGWCWLINPKKAAYNRVYNRTTTGCMLHWFLMLLLAGPMTFPFISCTDGDSAGSTYVQPSIDKNGKFRKGHVRKSVSTNKNAIKNQHRSRYYYKTRGKYRRKKKWLVAVLAKEFDAHDFKLFPVELTIL